MEVGRDARSGVGAALPGRRAQPAVRDHHLLEHVEARRRRLREEASRARDPGRTPGPRLAARLGAHQPDRGIPLARRRPPGTAKRTVQEGLGWPLPDRAGRRGARGPACSGARPRCTTGSGPTARTSTGSSSASTTPPPPSPFYRVISRIWLVPSLAGTIGLVYSTIGLCKAACSL